MSYAVSAAVAVGKANAGIDWAGPAYGIAYVGGRHVAVWSVSDSTPGPDGGFADSKFDIDVVAIEKEGGVAFHRTAFSAFAGSATVRAVEASSDGVGVLWCERPPGGSPRMVFARLTSEAVSLSPPVDLGTCDPQDPAALVWNGSGFGAAWGCAPETLCFARLDGNGTPIDRGAELRIPVRGVFGAMRMLWDLDRYALAWNETDPTYGADRLVVLSADGSAMAPAARLSEPSAYALSVFLTPSLRGYALAWATSDGSHLLEVDRAGAVITGPLPFPVAVPGALVYAAGAHAALFARPTLTDTQASYGFATLEITGRLISDEVLVSPQDLVHRISLHFDGNGFSVFSVEGDDSQLFFRRIDCSTRGSR